MCFGIENPFLWLSFLWEHWKISALGRTILTGKRFILRSQVVFSQTDISTFFFLFFFAAQAFSHNLPKLPLQTNTEQRGFVLQALAPGSLSWACSTHPGWHSGLTAATKMRVLQGKLFERLFFWPEIHASTSST